MLRLDGRVVGLTPWAAASRLSWDQTFSIQLERVSGFQLVHASSHNLDESREPGQAAGLQRVWIRYPGRALSAWTFPSCLPLCCSRVDGCSPNAVVSLFQKHVFVERNQILPYEGPDHPPSSVRCVCFGLLL